MNRRWLLPSLLVLSGVVQVLGQQTVPCVGPLNESAFTTLLQGGVSEARLQQWVTTCGVSFKMSPDMESRLRAAGATDAVVALLRRQAPAPAKEIPQPEPAAGTVQVWPGDGREMVRIPAGSFEMGSPTSEIGRKEDEAQHTIQVAAFWLDVTEVTNGAYRRFVTQNPEWQKDRITRQFHDGNYLRDWTGNDFPAGKDDSPVAWVSWHAARAYAVWAGKRLPTEAEWEYAARAGTKTAYWWGEAFDTGRVGAQGSPDASRRSPWGLLNMIGGVWEWTSTSYAPYPYVPTDGREDPSASGRRAVRGGFWNSGERFLRSANRASEQPELSSDLLGFRCAR